METFDQFEPQAIAEGKIDFDGVYGYQCVDLILQYAKVCFGIITGEAWQRNRLLGDDPSPVLLTKFDKDCHSKRTARRHCYFERSGRQPARPHYDLSHRQHLGSGTFEGAEQNDGNGDGDGSAGQKATRSALKLCANGSNLRWRGLDHKRQPHHLRRQLRQFLHQNQYRHRPKVCTLFIKPFLATPMLSWPFTAQTQLLRFSLAIITVFNQSRRHEVNVTLCCWRSWLVD